MSDGEGFGREAKALLEDEGWRVDVPGDRELFIDIDTDEQFAVFERCFEIAHRELLKMPEHCEPAAYAVAPSPGGLPKRHVRVQLPPSMPALTVTERVAWQAALGSDPVRETLALIRIQRGDDMPTIFKEIP